MPATTDAAKYNRIYAALTLVLAALNSSSNNNWRSP
jgi:hypothetical protein